MIRFTKFRFSLILRTICLLSLWLSVSQADSVQLYADNNLYSNSTYSFYQQEQLDIYPIRRDPNFSWSVDMNPPPGITFFNGSFTGYSLVRQGPTKYDVTVHYSDGTVGYQSINITILSPQCVADADWPSTTAGHTAVKSCAVLSYGKQYRDCVLDNDNLSELRWGEIIDACPAVYISFGGLFILPIIAILLCIYGGKIIKDSVLPARVKEPKRKIKEVEMTEVKTDAPSPKQANETTPPDNHGDNGNSTDKTPPKDEKKKKKGFSLFGKKEKKEKKEEKKEEKPKETSLNPFAPVDNKVPVFIIEEEREENPQPEENEKDNVNPFAPEPGEEEEEEEEEEKGGNPFGPPTPKRTDIQEEEEEEEESGNPFAKKEDDNDEAGNPFTSQPAKIAVSVASDAAIVHRDDDTADDDASESGNPFAANKEEEEEEEEESGNPFAASKEEEEEEESGNPFGPPTPKRDITEEDDDEAGNPFLSDDESQSRHSIAASEETPDDAPPPPPPKRSDFLPIVPHPQQQSPTSPEEEEEEEDYVPQSHPLPRLTNVPPIPPLPSRPEAPKRQLPSRDTTADFTPLHKISLPTVYTFESLRNGGSSTFTKQRASTTPASPSSPAMKKNPLLKPIAKSKDPTNKTRPPPPPPPPRRKKTPTPNTDMSPVSPVPVSPAKHSLSINDTSSVHSRTSSKLSDSHDSKEIITAEVPGSQNHDEKQEEIRGDMMILSVFEKGLSRDELFISTNNIAQEKEISNQNGRRTVNCLLLPSNINVYIHWFPDSLLAGISVDTFTKEKTFLTSLLHPYIARIHGFIHDSNTKQTGIITEASGECLSKVSDDASKIFSASQLYKMIKDSFTALSFLHNKGPTVIHGDLRPDNILMKGAACILCDPLPAFIPLKPAIPRTNIYLPPESYKQDKPDQKGDVYSLSKILLDVISKNTKKQTDIAATDETMYQQLSNLMRQAMASNPSTRMTAKTVLNELKQYKIK